MFARTGAAHGQGALDQTVIEAVGLGDFIGIVMVEHEGQVKIAVADMADQRRRQAALLNVFLGLHDAIGKPRDRHADVGRPQAATRPQCLGRIGGVMAGLPELVAFFGVGGPAKGAAAEILGNLAEHFGLFLGARLGAVEFQEQGRLHRVIEPGIGVDQKQSL